MSNQNNKGLKVFFGVVVCLAFSSVSAFAIINRQFVVDQIVVWRFETTSEVTDLVDRAGMNDYGKFLYLASEPVLESTQLFNSECQRTEVTTSILGCYKAGQIFLYDIDNPDLDGIRETTAAHETLHAAYARLSDSERTRVDGLLQSEYENFDHIVEYQELIEYYESAEPGQQNNELHSIIGTEIADISDELEDYYSKYFSNRQLVVALNTKYKEVFRVLNAKIEKLDAELEVLSNNIKNDVAQYNADTALLNTDIISFNAKANNGGFTTIIQFNSARQILINQIYNLEDIKADIESDIALYEEMTNEYNEIAIESQKLSNSINSSLAPLPSV